MILDVIWCALVHTVVVMRGGAPERDSLGVLFCDVSSH
eukprot:COSAG01_NODE_31631_length_594_cov_0.846465_1_plen_37_part_10